MFVIISLRNAINKNIFDKENTFLEEIYKPDFLNFEGIST